MPLIWSAFDLPGSASSGEIIVAGWRVKKFMRVVLTFDSSAYLTFTGYTLCVRSGDVVLFDLNGFAGLFFLF